MGRSYEKNSNPLRVLPQSQGFHFFIAVGHYCGVTSNSLEEFANVLQYICSEAIIFHFERGDFQNWIRDVIGDMKLAQEIDEIKMCSRQLSDEYCRKEIAQRVNIRILQLEVEKGNSCFSKQEAK